MTGRHSARWRCDGVSGKYTPLTPRNGHTLVVGVVARISGGPNQKELSLHDQVDHAKQAVAEMYEGTLEYRIVSTTGKGERFDRPELARVEQMLRRRELDLLIAEDRAVATTLPAPGSRRPVFVGSSQQPVERHQQATRA